MLPSETMIWQPEFTDKTLSRKPGAVQKEYFPGGLTFLAHLLSAVIPRICG
ncbi:hypothetical protein GKB28_14535 [Escherichia coli]|nr:hypothetical protein [Escherichia coli]EFH7481199.1 hypothetical protein [Escherichia coli]